MKVSEIKEKYLKLITKFNEKYEMYEKLEEKIYYEKDLMNEIYDTLETEYDWYRIAINRFPEVEETYLSFYKDNKEEIDYLLQFTEELLKISQTESLIKDLKYKSEHATKKEYHTEYDTEYYSEYDINLEMSTMRSRTVSKSVSEEVPDIDARKQAEKEMKRLIKELTENKYYNLYKAKYTMLENYLRLKQSYESLESCLNYKRIKTLAKRFVRHQKKCNQYIESINNLVAELESIVNVTQEIESKLKKKWKFKFIKDNPSPTVVFKKFTLINEITVEQLLNDLKQYFDRIEEEKMNNQNNEEEYIF